MAKGKGRLYNCDRIAGTFPSKLCAWSGNEVNAIGGPSRGPIFVGGESRHHQRVLGSRHVNWKGPESRSGIVSLVCPGRRPQLHAGQPSRRTPPSWCRALMAGLRDLSDSATRALLTWLRPASAASASRRCATTTGVTSARSLTRRAPRAARPIPPSGTFYMQDGSPLTRLAPTHAGPNGDVDGDSVLNVDDNCPTQANPTRPTPTRRRGRRLPVRGGRPPPRPSRPVGQPDPAWLADRQPGAVRARAVNERSPVPLKELVIRYWYSNEGTRIQQFFVDASPLGLQSLTGTFVRTPSNTPAPTPTSTSGSPPARSSTRARRSGPVRQVPARADFTNYDERDDYSRQGIAAKVKARAPGVELLSGGIGLWGNPPRAGLLQRRPRLAGHRAARGLRRGRRRCATRPADATAAPDW